MENNKPMLINEIKAEIKGISKVENNINEAKEFALKLKEYYKNLVFTDSDITLAKTERADINKTKKKIADYRISIIKEFKEPIELFESVAKETEKLLTETADFVDVQVKAFEDKKKQAKQEQINELLKLNDTGVPFANEKWLNATYKLETIEEEIKHFVNKFNNDMEVLKDEDIYIKDYYKQSLDISKTLLEKKRIQDLKKAEEIEKQKVDELTEMCMNELEETKQDEINLNFQEESSEIELKTNYILEIEVTRNEAVKLKKYLLDNNIEYKLIENEKYI